MRFPAGRARFPLGGLVGMRGGIPWQQPFSHRGRSGAAGLEGVLSDGLTLCARGNRVFAYFKVSPVASSPMCAGEPGQTSWGSRSRLRRS